MSSAHKRRGILGALAALSLVLAALTPTAALADEGTGLGSLSGTIASEGTLVEGATVSVFSTASGLMVAGTASDSSGYYLLGDLPFGEYTVHVYAEPDYETAGPLTVAISEGEPAIVLDLELVPVPVPVPTILAR